MSSKTKLELTWIGKNEKINLEPRILIEKTELSFNSEIENESATQDNILIHGDNLLALKALEQDYAGKIKCIYIDPPYNINAANPYYNDNIPISDWLSLMRPRLEILCKLLAEDGIIFAQIDDANFAYLKLLFDDIFTPSNYLNTILVKMKNIAGASGGGEDKRLKKNIEFLLSYTKNYNEFKWIKNAYNLTELTELLEEYKNQNISWKYTSVLVDSGEKEYLTSTIDGNGNEIKIYRRINPTFKSISQLAKELGKQEKEIYYQYMDKIFTTAMPQSSIRPRVMDKLGELSIECDFISIEYVPRTGKNKGKSYEQFYKGEKLRLLTWLSDVIENLDGKYYKKDLQGTLWEGINLNNLTKEGNVEFANSKKPEELIKRIIEISTNEGDIVLDSFLGSGTTAAVAHKMGRKWIGIELGDHAYSHCKPRLDSVLDGIDQGGISKSVNWTGGGSYKFYELAPTLIKKDSFGNPVINKEYNADMLAAAMAKHENYKYDPSPEVFWKQGKSSENAYIYTTTQLVTINYLTSIHSQMKENEHLVIACKTYEAGLEKAFKNITIKKIPNTLLGRCEFGKENYNLNIISVPQLDEEEEDNE